MNKAILVGRLTRDPEGKQISSGVAVTTFSIAVSRRFKKDETDYFNVVTWRGLAETCAKYLKRGSQVAVMGEMQTRSYDDKNGVKRYVTEIVADEVEFLSSRGTNSGDGEYKAAEQPTAGDIFGEELNAFEPVDDNELPF